MWKKITLGVLAVVCIVLIVYRCVNVSPDKTLTADEQALAILESGKCTMCHAQEPELPFYSKWPIIGKTVTNDAMLAARHIDLIPAIEALRAGEAVDIVSLNKIESSIANGTMPLTKFNVMHWGAAINSTERNMILAWVYNTREKEGHTLQGIPITLTSRALTDEAKVALGRILYNDTRLSGDNTVSCATCHNLDKGGCDNLQYSEGIRGQFGGVNAPTVFNAVFNFAQFWDGRAKTLADQAAGPPLNPIEMGSASFDEIIAKLAADEELTAQFTAAYPEGWSAYNICNAIQEYEYTLVTPNSPFDRYLLGDEEAMSADAVAGYDLFKANRCATCHAGINMGGQSYEHLGLYADYFADRGTELTEEDFGRGKQEESAYYDHRFKTPTLRNVALTAPYYHDGSIDNLSEAITSMMKYQVGKTLTEKETAQMKAFLESLTGEIPAK